MSTPEKHKLPLEKVLLQQIAEGDINAFELIFDHYRPILYTTSLRITGEETMAEEIVQDTFLKLWIKRESLPGIENLGGWLYKIASNLTLNAIKKKKNHQRTIQDWLKEFHNGESYPEITEDESNYKKLLDEAISRLPARQQKTFELIKQQGYKRGEVAAMLEISPETVKWNLDQALRSIRAYCTARVDSEILGVIFFLIMFY